MHDNLHLPRFGIAIHAILRKFAYPCATRYVDFIGFYGTHPFHMRFIGQDQLISRGAEGRVKCSGTQAVTYLHFDQIKDGPSCTQSTSCSFGIIKEMFFITFASSASVNTTAASESWRVSPASLGRCGS